MSLMSAEPPQLGSNVRWKIAWMLFLVTVVNYIDRQSFAVAAPVLLEELNLSKTQYGVIASAFLLAYAIGQAAGGRLIDRMGTKSAFTWAVSLWSAVCVLHALGRGYYSFMGLRAALGVLEAASFPTAVKTISEWFPASERSMAVGIFLAGASFGAMVAPPVLGASIHYVGWQLTFVFAGAVGYIWILLWRWYYAPPETHPKLSESERSYILDGRAQPPKSAKPLPILTLLKHREAIGLMLARFIGDSIFIFFTFWLPVYLSTERGLNILEIGYFAWIPFLFTDLGSLSAGWFATQLTKRGLTINATRKIMLAIAACLVPISMLAIWAESPLAAVLLIGSAMFFNQFKSVTTMGLPADLFPSHNLGTAWGWMGAAGSFGGFVFSPVIGWAVDNFSFKPVFIAVSLTPSIVLLIILIFIPKVKMLEFEGAPTAT